MLLVFMFKSLNDQNDPAYLGSNCRYDLSCNTVIVQATV